MRHHLQEFEATAEGLVAVEQLAGHPDMRKFRTDPKELEAIAKEHARFHLQGCWMRAVHGHSASIIHGPEVEEEKAFTDISGDKDLPRMLIHGTKLEFVESLRGQRVACGTC